MQDLKHDTTTDRPTWEQVWTRIGSEEMLAAKALLELSPTLLAEANTWVGYADRTVYSSDAWDAVKIGVERGEPEFQYDLWIADYDDRGRGWSSTEHRLFAVVSAILDPERPLMLRQDLGYLGSWETAVWRILVNWGTGGNNREYQGRATVVTR